MNSASFEGLWSAFTRLKMQRTWESISAGTDDRCGRRHRRVGVEPRSRACCRVSRSLIVMAALGLVKSFAALLGAARGHARRPHVRRARVDRDGAREGPYDMFTYYFSLGLMPMMLVSGRVLPGRAIAEGGELRRAAPAPRPCDRADPGPRRRRSARQHPAARAGVLVLYSSRDGRDRDAARAKTAEASESWHNPGPRTAPDQAHGSYFRSSQACDVRPLEPHGEAVRPHRQGHHDCRSQAGGT